MSKLPVKGAALAPRTLSADWRTMTRGSAAERFRARQLQAWREATGLYSPTVVPIAVNGREYASENDARKSLKAAA